MSASIENQTAFNEGLLNFLQASPTPFHAVDVLRRRLQACGFEVLNEADQWSLLKGGKYIVTRNDASLIAFKMGRVHGSDHGVHLTGAHTDSPCLKLKPNPETHRKGYLQLGVEVYGSALLNPWFDRDLSIAGRVSYVNAAGQMQSSLVNFKHPIAVIPSLAIHLDREVNQQRTVNAQQHLPAILLQVSERGEFDFLKLLQAQITKETGRNEAVKVLAHELSLYDTQPPALIGLQQQFIASARLDNLLSCYLACESLIASGDVYCSLLVCNDHEEVGSNSASGAQGPFLEAVLERMVNSENDAHDAMERAMHRSLLLSIDNAHGVHPNFIDKHDPEHSPLLNAGPVIKVNANQRYASNSESVALFRSYAEKLGVPVQNFVMCSDLACGSTIGPLTAARTGINTVDVGVPTFAMHSIRELAGADDALAMAKIVTAFYSRN
jgi:aspartyl aminopeptidase